MFSFIEAKKVELSKGGENFLKALYVPNQIPPFLPHILHNYLQLGLSLFTFERVKSDFTYLK